MSSINDIKSGQNYKQVNNNILDNCTLTHKQFNAYKNNITDRFTRIFNVSYNSKDGIKRYYTNKQIQDTYQNQYFIKTKTVVQHD